MRLRSEVKVGVIVTAGIAALIVIYWFLGGLGLRATTYPLYAIFPTTQKLDKGALVRMAGVKIGIVLDTSLTKSNEARVDLLIDNGIAIAKDSIARVTTGAFIGDYYVDITPGNSLKHLEAGDRLRTGTFAQPDKILQQVSDILTELQKSAKGINALVGDKELMSTIKDTVKSLKESADQASKLAAAARGMVEGAAPEVVRILTNLDKATAGACRAGTEIEEMIADDVRPNIRATLDNARKTTEKLDSAVQQAQDLIGSFHGAGDKVGSALTSLDKAMGTISETATEAKEMMGNFKDASAGVKNLATDQQLQQDVKTVVRNAACASEQLKELTEALNKKYGRGKNTPLQRSQVPERGATADALWNTTKGNYRFDANYTLPWSGNTFFRAGAFNIGEHTGVNLQGGKTYGRSALRYGLFDSRVSVGFNHAFSPSFSVSGDVFRPNDPEMELRGVLRAGKDFGIYASVLDLFHESDRDVYVGLRFGGY